MNINLSEIDCIFFRKFFSTLFQIFNVYSVIGAEMNPKKLNIIKIDYILVKKRFRNSIRDVKTLPDADIYSDQNKIKSNQKSWEEETKMEFGRNQEKTIM